MSSLATQPPVAPEPTMTASYAGLGGGLGADIIPVQWSYPFEHLVYFLIVVAIGGLGTLRGPFIGALLIGIGDTPEREQGSDGRVGRQPHEARGRLSPEPSRAQALLVGLAGLPFEAGAGPPCSGWVQPLNSVKKS